MENTLAILTGITTILLAYVAWQNYKINQSNFYIQKDKLRLDLFDRRLQVFEACQKLFSYLVVEGNMTHEVLGKFSRDSSNAEFLFGKDVKQYVDQVSIKGLRVIQINRLLDGSHLDVGDERSKLADELFVLEGWFALQYKESQEIFRKYLHFSIDRDP